MDEKYYYTNKLKIVPIGYQQSSTLLKAFGPNKNDEFTATRNTPIIVSL